jgi:hypothetical protein
MYVSRVEDGTGAVVIEDNGDTALSVIKVKEGCPK